jgi:hypothetical protein
MKELAETLTEFNITEPTEFERIVKRTNVKKDDCSYQEKFDNQMRNIIREIAAAYYFLRIKIGMDYVELTLTEFKSTQEKLLQMSSRKVKGLRHRAANLVGFKTAWQYFHENKYFHETRMPFKARSRFDRWTYRYSGMWTDGVATAYPAVLYVDYYKFTKTVFVGALGRDKSYQTMPPNVLNLAKKIYRERYNSEARGW